MLFSCSSSSCPVDHGLLYSIETLIVQWSEQIWNVLKKDSGSELLRGDHPGPLVELQFWATQKENLMGIQSQVFGTVSKVCSHLLAEKNVFDN